MRMIGYVPPVYQLDAMADSMSKRRRSNNLNYQRRIYEEIENNNECMFGEMLDTEIKLIKRMSEVY